MTHAHRRALINSVVFISVSSFSQVGAGPPAHDRQPAAGKHDPVGVLGAAEKYRQEDRTQMRRSHIDDNFET
jgi:hypothetical protein